MKKIIVIMFTLSLTILFISCNSNLNTTPEKTNEATSEVSEEDLSARENDVLHNSDDYNAIINIKLGKKPEVLIYRAYVFDTELKIIIPNDARKHFTTKETFIEFLEDNLDNLEYQYCDSDGTKDWSYFRLDDPKVKDKLEIIINDLFR